ncbi:MAG: hypothetical protein ACJA0Q_000951 [Saprospiraceae bacterium]|jgi:hypothetical protein
MIETIPSKLYWLLGFFLCFVISWFFYRKEFFLSSGERKIKWGLIILRAMSLFVVFFLCLDPFISYQQKHELKPELLILVDDSQSIELAGVSADSIQNILNDFKRRISSDMLLSFKTLGDEVKELDTLSFNESKTDFQQAFFDVANLYEGRDLAGVIVVSDGIVNAGSKHNLAGALKCPVYTLGVGDSLLKKDLAVKHLYYNDKAIVGNEFPIRVEGISTGCRGEELMLEFYLGAKKVAVEKVQISKDDYSFAVNKMVLADSVGLRRLRVRVLEKNEEFTYVNNELVGFVQVLKEKKKIQILYSHPHPDIAAFKASMSEVDAYEVTSSSFEKYEWEGAPNLIVLFGMPESKREFQSVEAKLKNESANLLYFMNNKVNYDWMGSPEFKVEKSGQNNEVQFSLNPSFSLFQISEESAKKIEVFPPVVAPYGEYVFARDFKILGSQRVGKVKTEFPLICFKQNGKRRISVVVGEGVWKWRMYEIKESVDDQASAFDELLQKTVRYLTVDFNANRIQLEVKNLFELGESVVLKARVTNSIKEEVIDLKINVAVMSDHEHMSFLMNNLENGYQLEVGKLQPGEYTIVLTSELDGKKISTSKKIVVKAFYLEQMVLKANHKLLRDLSNKSNGKFYNIADAQLLLDDLNKIDYSIKSYFEFFTESLMKFKWLLYVLIGILGVEWFIRKWYGTI